MKAALDTLAGKFCLATCSRHRTLIWKPVLPVKSAYVTIGQRCKKGSMLKVCHNNGHWTSMDILKRARLGSRSPN
jgi:hypothetical protein